MSKDSPTILLTKLHRPRPAPDAIVRPRLMGTLHHGLNGPLTLVSAAAGFGKSTLLSQWVEDLGEDWRCGWYAVDESDNDLRVFLLYLVSTVRLAVPDSCAGTLDLVQRDALPEPADLAVSFCNDLIRIEERLILVIDDFHRIQESAINEFLIGLLGHPPPGLHLAIATRRDPTISLRRWRANGALNEVRLKALRFNEEEVEAYLGKALESDLPPTLVELASNEIEGWPVAMRLLVLAMRGAGSMETIMDEMPSVPTRVSGYLIGGILDRLEPDRLEALLKFSVLDRFCPGLCVAVVPGIDAPAFLRWLMESELFLINLDERDHWFRFHHLFQESLQQQLVERFDEKTVRDSHRLAAEWLAENDLLEDAIKHAIKAGEHRRAGEFVGRALRTTVLQGSGGEWGRGWLDELPDEVIQESPALLVEEARYKTGKMEGVKETLERAESLLEEMDLDVVEESWIRGNLLNIRCSECFNERDFETLIASGQEALRLLPREPAHVTASTFLLVSIALRSMGRATEARRLVEGGIKEFSGNPVGLGYMHSAETHRFLMAADMPGLRGSAQQFFDHSNAHDIWWISGMARVFLGMAHYQLNDLEEAEALLTVTESDRSQMEYRSAVYCDGYRVLIFLAGRRWQEAEALIESMLEDTRVEPNRGKSDLAEALGAELALRRGQVSKAIAWVDDCEPVKPVALSINMTPAPIYVRALLAKGTEESRANAAEFLAPMVADADLVRFNEARIMFRALQALLHRDEGNEGKALSILGEAIRIAQPGGALRLFADFGEELLPLLHRLELDTEGVEYVGRIVLAMGPPSESENGAGTEGMEIPAPPAGSLVEALTKREFEILLLTSQRLSNNEIAERLFISPGTVKRHLSNIYEKLAVHGRKEAVAKAVGLGLLKR